MKIGIVGYGHVGRAMHKLFQEAVLKMNRWYWVRGLI